MERKEVRGALLLQEAYLRQQNQIINERRDVYGLMTERCDIVLKSFRKEEK
jgi:hypothetical protein